MHQPLSFRNIPIWWIIEVLVIPRWILEWFIRKIRMSKGIYIDGFFFEFTVRWICVGWILNVQGVYLANIARLWFSWILNPCPIWWNLLSCLLLFIISKLTWCGFSVRFLADQKEVQFCILGKVQRHDDSSRKYHENVIHEWKM